MSLLTSRTSRAFGLRGSVKPSGRKVPKGSIMRGGDAPSDSTPEPHKLASSESDGVGQGHAFMRAIERAETEKLEGESVKADPATTPVHTPDPSHTIPFVESAIKPNPENVRPLVERFLVAGRLYSRHDLAQLPMTKPKAKPAVSTDPVAVVTIKDVAKLVKAENGSKVGYSGYNKAQLVEYIFSGGKEAPCKEVVGTIPGRKALVASLKANNLDGYSHMNVAELNEYLNTGEKPKRRAPNYGTTEWLRNIARMNRETGGKGHSKHGTKALLCVFLIANMGGITDGREALISYLADNGYADALLAAGIES